MDALLGGEDTAPFELQDVPPELAGVTRNHLAERFRSGELQNITFEDDSALVVADPRLDADRATYQAMAFSFELGDDDRARLKTVGLAPRESDLVEGALPGQWAVAYATYTDCVAWVLYFQVKTHAGEEGRVSVSLVRHEGSWWVLP